MSVKPDHSEDEEGIQGPEVTVVETNRFGFILGNGEIDSDGPCPEIVRHRESKWLSLMTQWDHVMEKKSNKVKGQCQKGIPASVRAKGWPLLCGAKERKDNNFELYKRLAGAPDHQGWTDIIKRDTDRQFPFHEMFQSKDGHGQKDLLEVLKAYTQYRPDEGYCQAQGPVAAVLLMNMPAEEAFWCLVQISELYLSGYYSPLLEGVLFDAAVLSSVLKKLCPAAHKHLQNQGVEPLMFATDWLMCLYSRHLPFNTLLRVWDLFFCYGVRVLFQVAVVFVRRCLGEGRQRKECDGQMETLERLRRVKERIQNEQTDAFIHEVCSVSLSSADLQKQTEKELEKWKKERPNSTFDPRGRCHGYRMAWERAHDKQKELEKKERQKGNLTLPVMRSHSSLSPSLLRKKWRKRSSKTDTEEWDGGGRKFSRSVMEESENEELRRKSVCGIVGEQRAKQDRLADEFCTRKHKDHKTHPNISVVVSSSIDCDVFEKQHTETSLNQQKGDSETTETAGCVVEESIQTHHQELQTEKDTNTEAPTNQNEQKTDEQNVEINRMLEPCKEITPVEKEDTQADFSKQKEEMQPDSNIQEVETQTEHGNQQEKIEDRLPQVIIHEDNQQTEDNIPENIIVQEEQRCQTSRGQYEELEHRERQKEKELHLPTVTEEDKETQLISADVDDEKGFSQEFNNPLEETGDTLDIPEVCEEEGRQNISLEQRETRPHSASEEAMQTSEEVLISSSLKTEQESNSEHPDMQKSQSRNPEHNDMDAIVTDGELVHCPVASTLGVKAGSGNLELNEMNVADATTTLEPQEGEATAASMLSIDTGMDDSAVATSDDIETSENNPETCEENKSTLPENTLCCKDSITNEESCSLTQTYNNVPVTSESGKSESNVLESGHRSPERNDVHAITESGNLEINKTDVTTESEIPESNDLQIAVVSGNTNSDIKGSAVENPESYQVLTAGSVNVVDEVIGCDPPETNREHVITGSNPACNTVHWADESDNPETNSVYSTVCNPENNNVLVKTEFENPPCSNAPITNETSKSTHSDSSVVDLSVESVNQDNEVNVLAGPEKPQTKDMEIAVATGNSECNITGSTFENPERIPVLVTAGSGNPESNDIHVKTESGNPESNIETLAIGPGKPDQLETREHDTGGSGNPEYDKGDTAESGNPDNLECAIPANSQALDSPSSIPSSKSPNLNVPPAQLRVRRPSSSRVSYHTILSEDTFKEPQQQEHTHSENMTHTLSQDTHVTPSLPTKVDVPKRLGLFRRLRGETNKATIPKIVIQDFSEKEERLTAKERRRRKREKERKEREEKDRKKLEKEMEKDKAKDRKKPQTRGKSFQVLSRKCADNVVSPGDCDSQTSHPRRNSVPFSDSYF